MNKQYLFSLLVSAVFATAASLAEAETVRTADFEQTKTMQGLNITLKANGTILLSEKNGLLWHQLSPIAVKTHLSKTFIRTKTDGTPVQTISLTENPQMSAMPAFISCILSGNENTLKSFFALKSSSVNEKKETLVLEPKVAPFTQIFSEITLVRRQNFILAAKLKDRTGDLTDIQFSNSKTIDIDEKTLSQRFTIE